MVDSMNPSAALAVALGAQSGNAIGSAPRPLPVQ
jgi:hypothetical protein